MYHFLSFDPAYTVYWNKQKPHEFLCFITTSKIDADINPAR